MNEEPPAVCERVGHRSNLNVVLAHTELTRERELTRARTTDRKPELP